LLLNKIAVEFYAYNDLPIESISDLRAKLNELDQSIDNVKFCNFNEEIREFETKEISHLITIQNDVESKILFAYIELFNVICAVIPLIKDYKGDKVCVSYKQDVISGNRIDGDIILKKTISDFLLSDEPNLDMKFGV